MTDRHLPANASLTYFTVTCHLAPIIADVSQDADYDPNTTRIDATVTFTPKYKTGEVIHSHTSNPPTGFLALPVTAIIDDGYLKLRSKPDLGAAPLPGTLHGLKARIAAENNLEVPEVRALNYAPVRLLGNSASLEIEPDQPLYYDFTFSNIKIDNKATNIAITGGTFEAPWEDTVIDLLDYMPLSPGPYAAPMVVGPQGPQGPPGPATIEVGSTTTSAPGTDAVVTNSGTEQDAVLDFVIPRGDVGPAGALLEFDTVAAFPATGTTGQVYLAKDTGDAYRWDAAAKTNTYVRISERVPAVGIEDSSEVGRAVVTAADELAARTVLDVQRHAVFDVREYGAVRDGVADDTAAVHAARDAAGVGGTVVFPKGTYKVGALVANVADQTWLIGADVVVKLGSRMDVPASGVTIRGAGRDTSKLSCPESVIRFSGESDITVADLTLESTATEISSIGINSTFTGIQKRVSVTGCRITGTRSNAARFGGATRVVEQLRFSDNIVEDCVSGVSLSAPTLASGISSQIKFTGNYFRRVGHVNISIFGATSGNREIPTIKGVEISGNDFRDFGEGLDGDTIPLEPSGIEGLVISNNVISDGGSRGISMGNNIDTTITGNVIRGQSIYAFELGGGKNISIVGNTIENCSSFAKETGYPGQTGFTGIPLSNVLIADNLYTGSGETADGPSDFVFWFTTVNGLRISGNLFRDWEFLDNAIRIGVSGTPTFFPQDCVVEGNTFVVSNANTPIRCIAVDSSVRTNIVRNTIKVLRNLTSSDNSRVVEVAMRSVSSDTLVEGNHIIFFGTTAAAGANASGIGNDAATPAACPKLTVRRNTVVNGPRGLRLLTTSTDLVVDDNDTSSCVSADLLPSTVTFSNHKFGTLDVGHLTDTTLSRVSAGVLAVENVQLSRAGHTHTATEVLGAHSWSTVPAAAASTGTAGQMAYDAGFLYIAVGANQWRRVALTTW